jgi:hypothetical protein
VPSPGCQGEGHGRGEDPGSAALRDFPAYGAWNVQRVATGTGEALPGPTVLRLVAVGARRPITGLSREVGGPAGWASEAAVVPIEPSGQHNRR